MMPQRKLDFKYLSYLKKVGLIKGFNVPAAPAKRGKFGNVKVRVDGRLFDSKREAARYVELKIKQAYQQITDLQCQVPFVLIKANGKEKACTYRADFTYRVAGTGELVVEDSKGVKTADYLIKRKLMLQVHGISIKEV